MTVTSGLLLLIMIVVAFLLVLVLAGLGALLLKLGVIARYAFRKEDGTTGGHYTLDQSRPMETSPDAGIDEGLDT